MFNHILPFAFSPFLLNYLLCRQSNHFFDIGMMKRPLVVLREHVSLFDDEERACQDGGGKQPKE